MQVPVGSLPVHYSFGVSVNVKSDVGIHEDKSKIIGKLYPPSGI